MTHAAALRMEREMFDARLVDLDGTSHFLPLEKPDEIACPVIEFAAGRVDP